MKTFDVKHSDIVNFENILEADKNASQCKHYRDENLKFSAHREEGIIDLLNRLTYYPVFDEEGNQIPGKTESSYKVGRYRKKQIYEPKPRIIMALEYPDRVVQWAYYQILNPLFDSQLRLQTRKRHNESARTTSTLASKSESKRKNLVRVEA